MRYGLYVPNFGEFATARTFAELARAAEDAGWDGFFLWDHILNGAGLPMVDPWVALTAMALGTERLRLGPLVTPLPRRRPWKLARESASLDQLSGGRLVQGVGIGGDWWGEYSAFAEPPEDKVHGAMLDEGLEVLAGLWSGEPFSYQGTYYKVTDAHFLPTPAQRPRIPVWVAGIWPNRRPIRRAARWDGVFPILERAHLTPDDVRTLLQIVAQERIGGAPFDVVLRGEARERTEEAAAMLRDYAAAGVTWWLESFGPRATTELLRERIHQGPPREAEGGS
jgi:alkanesulfonate monooxygenase SsuD/methylene tetrahydromethanopterin reductase-like flavin-dependent oxidoreductase (luciferase family)